MNTSTNHSTVITVSITSNQRLSNAGFRRSGGNSSGAAHWWLKDADDRFVDLPRRVRGDARGWSMTLELAPGKYTLGTGRGGDRIRETREVTPDGRWI